MPKVDIAGVPERKGTGYKLSARVVRSVTGQNLATVDASAANKEQVLAAAGNLAASIRKEISSAILSPATGSRRR